MFIPLFSSYSKEIKKYRLSQKKQYKGIANDLLKEIIYIPWLYNKNKNVLYEIQNKYL